MDKFESLNKELELLESKDTKRTEYFNAIQQGLHSDIKKTYENFAFLAGSLLSLSIGFLPLIKEKFPDSINQYSLLYLIGITLLFLSLIAGIFYRLASSKDSLFGNMVEILKNRLKLTNKRKEIVEGFPEKVNILGSANYDIDLERYQEAFDTNKNNRSFYSKVITVTSYISIPLFIVGATLVGIYFIVQIFDFSFISFY